MCVGDEDGGGVVGVVCRLWRRVQGVGFGWCWCWALSWGGARVMLCRVWPGWRASRRASESLVWVAVAAVAEWSQLHSLTATEQQNMKYISNRT